MMISRCQNSHGQTHTDILYSIHPDIDTDKQTHTRMRTFVGFRQKQEASR